jgi:hypothetical protein
MLDLKDWSIIGATILGPILAVQAQKWVEIIRERRGRKLWIFHTLMATRAARTSTEHVQALNMIDLIFMAVENSANRDAPGRSSWFWTRGKI